MKNESVIMILSVLRKSRSVKVMGNESVIYSQGQLDPGAINQSCISGATRMEIGLSVGESGVGPLGFSNICCSIQVFAP